ncbi:hypothetical protein [Streptomyces sp. NPDC087862]|uniref:hypothetical protein n=1 Tax=Streptomyces sp. NPDC087862 TaxID=3365813 RepID=UPI0038169413
MSAPPRAPSRVDDRPRPRRTGERDDVNFHDGGEAPARIEIEGYFRYRDPSG